MSRHGFAHGRRADNLLPDETPSPVAVAGQGVVGKATVGEAAAAEPVPPGTFTSHATGSELIVQNSTASAESVIPHFPFQPLPTPVGALPYHFDLSRLLDAASLAEITSKGKLVFHAVGDTGDSRGTQMDFVAAMMTQDYNDSADGEVPAFCYHLGDVVYFAGDISMYPECFYETYASYPALIVSIAGNHDAALDTAQDSPGGVVDPNKASLDGWVLNFMSQTPEKLGSPKTTSSRTQMDLPNVYWTFTTPFATIIGLYSNVSETEADIREPQVSWFKTELKTADPQKALIVVIHHPPYSGDQEHSGSSKAEEFLFSAFNETNVYPHMIMSGHVHNYQRFTVTDSGHEIACLVHGSGGYKTLGHLRKIKNEAPKAPLKLTDSLTLESYDDVNFGFLRIEVSANAITGTYYSDKFQAGDSPKASAKDSFAIDLDNRTVSTKKTGSPRAEQK